MEEKPKLFHPPPWALYQPPPWPIPMCAFLHTSSFSPRDHQPQAETETSLFESEKQQVKLLILSLFNVFLFPSQE